MLFLEAYIIFSTFSFPLGTTSPLHNFIKMYKLSKIYTRGRRAKAAITEKTTKISLSIQVTPKKKKIAKFLGTRSMGNQSHLLASEGGVPVCTVRAVPATVGEVFLQTFEVESLKTLCWHPCHCWSNQSKAALLELCCDHTLPYHVSLAQVKRSEISMYFFKTQKPNRPAVKWGTPRTSTVGYGVMN